MRAPSCYHPAPLQDGGLAEGGWILEVTVQQKRKKVSPMRITAGHGSAELTGLLEKIKAKKASVAAADATKAAASADRAARKTESDATLRSGGHANRPAHAIQKFSLALPSLCPMACWRLCLFCGNLKKRQFGAKACKEAAAAVKPPSEDESELQVKAGSGSEQISEEEGE